MRLVALFLFLCPLLVSAQVSTVSTSFATGQIPAWNDMMQAHVNSVSAGNDQLSNFFTGVDFRYSYYSEQNRIGGIMSIRYLRNFILLETGYAGWESAMVSFGLMTPALRFPIGKTFLDFTNGFMMHFPSLELNLENQRADMPNFLDYQGFGVGVNTGISLGLIHFKSVGLFLQQYVQYTPFMRVFRMGAELNRVGIPIKRNTHFWEYRAGLALKYLRPQERKNQ